jgi:hypothetical protein
MTISNEQELKKAFLAFKESAVELMTQWDKYEGTEDLSENYPFNDSFDELLFNIKSWVESSVQSLDKEQPKDEDLFLTVDGNSEIISLIEFKKEYSSDGKFPISEDLIYRIKNLEIGESCFVAIWEVKRVKNN